MNATRISQQLDVSLFDANIVLALIRYRIDPEKYPRRFPRTCAWLNQCYHKPRQNEIALEAINEVLDLHGIEAVEDGRFFVNRYHGSIVASYVNTGDSYAGTILLDHLSSKWRLTSWGDFVESLDARVDQEDDDE